MSASPADLGTAAAVRGDASRLLLGAAVASAAFGALAVRSPSLALAALVGAAFTILALWSFTTALALFAAVTFLEGVPGFAGTLSVVKLATFALIVAWAVLLWTRRRLPLLVHDRPRVVLCAAVLAAWALASALWATDPGASESGAFRLVQMLLLLFLVFSAVRDGRDLRLFAWAYIGGAVLTTLVALAGFGPGAQGAGAVRFGGYLGNPNNLAAALLPALALCGFMAIGSRRPFERLLLAAAGLLLLVSLLLTESRGGLIGVVVAVLVAVPLAGPARRKALGLLIVLAVGTAVYFGFVASSGARHRATEFSASQSTGRVDLWHVALRMFESQPLHGIGLDNFIVLAPGYLVAPLDVQRADLFLKSPPTLAHNTYLTVLAELGIVGEILFVGLVVGVLVVALRSVRLLVDVRDAETELLGRGLLVGAFGMLTAYVFFSAQYEKQLWLVLGALLSLSTVAGARARASEAVSSKS